MSIDEILEEMDELLDKASSVPFVSHKKVIDGERMRELINDVRLNMPHELKEAKKIEFDCQRILNEAKLNAESIIRKAEERAAQIVSREAIVTEAKKKALDMLTKAQTAAKNLQQNAAASVAKMLNDTENYYSRNLQSIKVVKGKIGSTLSSASSDKKNDIM
ncbi:MULTISPECIES: vacuolar-type H+-ATPase subunit H [Ruminococcus]|jgi:vacuolar-type H+-ATPase subunit H|uniref:Vacuolar-type H+-ATPase subunit H n=1 Tax=Ruminococcus flavefaciens TaxID=1265 RepID=A0A315XTI8_RUMFL|nr:MULTISPECIES: vacuolar-type H+-ATPase subunit H [Ruminococcus]MBQ6170792.1 vacuolar-type H+-ATPase subunit H [Ruminococcus sp.]MBQ6252132.1 vacuolar-type H+-ATPase subunit H [Ruminococcus sp.]MBR1429729.1 vacuolar-type H+-ATPase subunit H [Ruminococcus sp.]MBR3667899.1 vacuolar-type H+-ATPase subunit H [Ruminococcus sp.]MBR6996355.1 vacuolar-type H+-ATPase subunit H [Ruminococcus sp.]